jgi:hypothetical protein
MLARFGTAVRGVAVGFGFVSGEAASATAAGTGVTGAQFGTIAGVSDDSLTAIFLEGPTGGSISKTEGAACAHAGTMSASAPGPSVTAGSGEGAVATAQLRGRADAAWVGA